MKKIILPFFIFIGVVYCCWMSMIWMQWAYIETDVDNFNSLFEALHAIRMRSILTLFSLSITICLMVYYSLKLICKIKKNAFAYSLIALLAIFFFGIIGIFGGIGN